MTLNKLKNILKSLSLRPTPQRIAIIETLLNKGDTHVTAHSLEKMLLRKKCNIAKATIYNNLNELSERGFLKKVLVEKDKMWFDTNLSEHHHFYDKEENILTDVAATDVHVSKIPSAPLGKKVDDIEVTINVSRKK